MPILKHYVDEDDDRPIIVSIMTQPQDDLPVKEWKVEIARNEKIGDLKHRIYMEYSVDQDLIRLCTAASKTDPGLKDEWKIIDLPVDPEHTDMKKVFLLPKKNKGPELLDKILDWADREGCQEEYTSMGAKYTNKDDEDEKPTKKSQLSRAMSNSLISLKKKSRKSEKVQMKIDGDKMELEEPDAPMVEKLPFNLVAGIMAAGNMLVVGLEADYTCWGLGLEDCPISERTQWFALDCIFTLWFCFEVVLRAVQIGPVQYFCGNSVTNRSGFSSTANCIDTVVVFFRLLDTFIFDLVVGVDSKIKIISCFRILQFARVARLMRLVRSVRELWLIVAGMTDLCKTVMWVMILLMLIFWIIGILMTVVVGHDDGFFDYRRSDWGKSEYFDTVPKSVFSLLQIMTLSQWSTIISRPIVEQYPSILLILLPFLMITTVGLLNIIVGVVVEQTLTSATNNAEKEQKEVSKVYSKVMESLKMVFEEADTDGGGTLDRQELHKSLKKPHVRDRLKVLDIPVKDLDRLFDVLDEDGAGEIRTDHFFRGCSRLRGPALACDLHRMSVDFSRYIQWTTDLLDSTHSQNEKLQRLLTDMQSVDRDIIKGEADEFDPVLGNRRDRSFAKEKKEQKFNQDNPRSNSRGKGEQRSESKRSGGSNNSRRPSLMGRTLTGGFDGGTTFVPQRVDSSKGTAEAPPPPPQSPTRRARISA